MTSLHSDLIELSLHRPFSYEQTSDPGAVGAGKYWLDTTSVPYIIKRRNAGDTGWEVVGGSGGSSSSSGMGPPGPQGEDGEPGPMGPPGTTGATGAAGIASQLDANGTTLDVNVITDGEYLKRVGTTVVSGTPSGSGSVNYNPDLAPTSPSAANDEFDDDVVGGAWTQFGSPDTVDEADLHGFIKLADNDGVDSGIWEAYVPGAAVLTVAIKVSGDVAGAASNQVNLSLRDSSNNKIVSLGMLNAAAWIATAAAFGGGFTSGTIYNGPGNLSTVYFAIQRDAGTNYTFWVSPDGIIWRQVASCSQAGTVARISLDVAGFSASVTTAYFDFVRAFASQTTKIGNTP